MSDLRDRSIVRKKYLVDLKNYSVVKKLKSGGFGKIYSIRDKKTNNEFAAKILPLDDENEQAKKMINREIGIMMLIHHQTFVQFYGYSLQDFDGKDNVTIIMNLVKNGSLATLLQKVQKGLADINYDNTTRQKILIGISRGMMYLHQHRIIHRDLKPDNVLLDELNNPHITDFGLSKIIEYGCSQNQTQSYGTSIYMAPEVIKGDRYNGKADVYSFSILMYEVITDTVPYPLFQSKKMSLFQFNNKIVSEKYRPEFTVPIKEPLKKLIIQCWSENPNERPTFEEIFNKLAFNIEESVYDVFTGDDEYKYYLDGVDADEVLDYAFSVSQDEPERIGASTVDHDSEIKILREKNEMLSKKLSEDEKLIKRLENENAEMKKNIAKLFELIEKSSKETTNSKPSKETTNSKPSKETTNSKPSKETTNSKPSKETTNLKPPFSPSKPKESTKEFKLAQYPGWSSEDNAFKGIMRYLFYKTDRNVHSSGLVEITSNSCDGNQPCNIGDIGSDSYFSKNEKDAYVIFDFKDRSVRLKQYSIKSGNGETNKSHLRSWDIRASNDKVTWVTLDSRKNESGLNGALVFAAFDVTNQQSEFYRYIQILSRGKSWNQCGEPYRFGINCVDFFGDLYEE